MKVYETDSSLKIHDIEHKDNEITMLLSETVENGVSTFCCIRKSDPYLSISTKLVLDIINNFPEIAETKFNLLGYKISEELGLPFADEIIPKQSLISKIKGVFSGKV